jgi:hypothetical protein
MQLDWPFFPVLGLRLAPRAARWLAFAALTCMVRHANAAPPTATPTAPPTESAAPPTAAPVDDRGSVAPLVTRSSDPKPAAAPHTTTPAPAGSEPDVPEEAPAAASGPTPEVARRLGGSAHADRVVLLPTAYTHPEGTFYVSDYDIVVLQTGYAVSDNAQLTATFTPPVEEELVVPLDLSLKVSSGTSSPVRVAGIGSVTGVLGLDDGPALIGRVGGVAQFCFDDLCRTSISAGASSLLVGTVVLLMGSGAEVRLANWLSLLVEADLAMPLGVEPAQAKGLLLAGGARLPFRNWALDLTVAGSASAFDRTGSPPIPLVVYTYRWMPTAYRHAPR